MDSLHPHYLHKRSIFKNISRWHSKTMQHQKELKSVCIEMISHSRCPNVCLCFRMFMKIPGLITTLISWKYEKCTDSVHYSLKPVIRKIYLSYPMVKIILLCFFISSACGNTEKSLCKVLYVKGFPGHSKEVHTEIMKNVNWGYSQKK